MEKVQNFWSLFSDIPLKINLLLLSIHHSTEQRPGLAYCWEADGIKLILISRKNDFTFLDLSHVLGQSKERRKKLSKDGA